MSVTSISLALGGEIYRFMVPNGGGCSNYFLCKILTIAMATDLPPFADVACDMISCGGGKSLTIMSKKNSLSSKEIFFCLWPMGFQKNPLFGQPDHDKELPFFVILAITQIVREWASNKHQAGQRLHMEMLCPMQ